MTTNMWTNLPLCTFSLELFSWIGLGPFVGKENLKPTAYSAILDNSVLPALG